MLITYPVIAVVILKRLATAIRGLLACRAGDAERCPTGVIGIIDILIPRLL